MSNLKKLIFLGVFIGNFQLFTLFCFIADRPNNCSYSGGVLEYSHRFTRVRELIHSFLSLIYSRIYLYKFNHSLLYPSLCKTLLYRINLLTILLNLFVSTPYFSAMRVQYNHYFNKHVLAWWQCDKTTTLKMSS